MRFAILSLAAAIALPGWATGAASAGENNGASSAVQNRAAASGGQNVTNDKPHIWIAPSAAWRTHGDSNRSEGEVENRSVEISANFAKSCKEAAVNAEFLKSDYIIELSRRSKPVTPTRFVIVRTDIAVFRPNGDLVGGAAKSSIGAAVKVACDLIKTDWPTAAHGVHPSPKSQSPEARPTAKPVSYLQR